MAKDGTNRGGPRIGSGQKKKPLRDKTLEGNPGKRPLQIIEFQPDDSADLTGQPMPPPHEFLYARQKDGRQTLLVVSPLSIVGVWRVEFETFASFVFRLLDECIRNACPYQWQKGPQP